MLGFSGRVGSVGRSASAALFIENQVLVSYGKVILVRVLEHWYGRGYGYRPRS